MTRLTARSLAALGFAALALPGISVARAGAPPSVAAQTIDTMNAAWGKHPGARANHAKGVVVEGSFTPSAAGPALSIAPIFASGTIPVTARFSDSTGLPDIADNAGAANPHGMAVRFNLPGHPVDIVANSLGFFPVRTGEEFLAFLQANVASKDAPHPTPVEKFIAAHPSVAKAFATVATPVSFAAEKYNGVDAFIFVDSKGGRHPFRFALVPVAGVHHLSPRDAAPALPNFLVDELPIRLKGNTVQFHLTAVLAEPGDPTNDATQPWPADRKSVDLGLITLTRPAADNAAAEKALHFLPNNLCKGIELSDDPLIMARVRAYLISFGRRAG